MVANTNFVPHTCIDPADSGKTVVCPLEASCILESDCRLATDGRYCAGHLRCAGQACTAAAAGGLTCLAKSTDPGNFAICSQANLNTAKSCSWCTDADPSLLCEPKQGCRATHEVKGGLGFCVLFLAFHPCFNASVYD